MKKIESCIKDQYAYSSRMKARLSLNQRNLLMYQALTILIKTSWCNCSLTFNTFHLSKELCKRSLNLLIFLSLVIGKLKLTISVYQCQSRSYQQGLQPSRVPNLSLKGLESPQLSESSNILKM